MKSCENFVCGCVCLPESGRGAASLHCACVVVDGADRSIVVALERVMMVVWRRQGVIPGCLDRYTKIFQLKAQQIYQVLMLKIFGNSEMG